jgi:hypothetical protein
VKLQEQLPTPVLELLFLNLYLGSITYLIGVVFILFVMRANGFNWFRFLIITLLSIGLNIVTSLILWVYWPAGIDIMLLFIHLPTLISLSVISVILLLLFGQKIKLKKV